MQHEAALNLAAHTEHGVTAPREVVHQQRCERVVRDEVPDPVGLAVLSPCEPGELDAEWVALGRRRVCGWAVAYGGVGVAAASHV